MAPAALSAKVEGLVTCGVVRGGYGESNGTTDYVAYNGIAEKWWCQPVNGMIRVASEACSTGMVLLLLSP